MLTRGGADTLGNFIGIDIGTSAVKAILVDEDETLLAGAAQPLGTQNPHALWSEQDPLEWWRAVERVLAQLCEEAPKAWREVKALGLSGQMHGAVLLDAQGGLIRPAILWNDGRAATETRRLNDMVPRLGEIAGVPAMVGFTAPKLLWLERHEPDNFRRIARILLPKDYIRLCMTGVHATDMTDASGTLWLDVARRQWSREIIAATGIRIDQLPALAEGADLAGTLRADVAAALGLPRDVAVAIGTGDVAAAAIGLGAIADGDGFISLGTSAQYFVAADRHRPHPETFVHAFAHALPDRWFQTAAILNGAGLLGWLAQVLGAPIETLLAEAEAAFAGPSPLTSLPYLAGERTPHNDPDAKAVIYGLTPGVTRAGIVQSALEAVAFALADGQDALAKAETFATHLAVTGGGARSLFWMRILATVLDRPLMVHGGGAFGPALGAARLARLALTGEPSESVCLRPVKGVEVAPDPHLVAAYRDKRADFIRLYATLRAGFAQNALAQRESVD